MSEKRNRHERDENVTLSCSWCGSSFHPWKNNAGYDTATRYCSKACRSRAILSRVNGNPDADIVPMPVRQAVKNEDTPAELPTQKELDVNWRMSGEFWDKVSSWFADRQAAERKRAAQKDSAYNSLATEGQTITITGYGAKLSVKQDNLIVQHGITYSTEDVREEILHRGIHNVSSIVWFAENGSGLLSIAALQWCASQNIVIRLIAHRGKHLATLYPSPDAPQALGIPKQENGRTDVKLRRAQYALEPTGKDIPLARTIILRKIEAQISCLDKHPELPDRERGYAALDVATKWLSQDPPTPGTSSLDGIRLYEARASNGYFMAWRGLPLQIDEKA